MLEEVQWGRVVGAMKLGIRYDGVEELVRWDASQSSRARVYSSNGSGTLASNNE